MNKDAVITNPATGRKYIIFRVGYRVRLLRDLSESLRHGEMGTVKEVVSVEIPQLYQIEFDSQPGKNVTVFGAYLYCMAKPDIEKANE